MIQTDACCRARLDECLTPLIAVGRWHTCLPAQGGHDPEAGVQHLPAVVGHPQQQLSAIMPQEELWGCPANHAQAVEV